MRSERFRQLSRLTSIRASRIVATVSPHTTSLVSADADGDWRYERKYFLETISAEEADLLVRNCPRYFRKCHPDRYINNIYLDSETLRCFWENLDGVSPRFKQRVRWYGDLYQDNAEPVLEIKRKYNAVGDKIRVPLRPFDSANEMDDDGVARLLSSAGSGRPCMSHGIGFRCRLVNRYLRSYYATFDGLFRATVDRELQFYPLRGGGGLGEVAVHASATIVEIKYARDHDVLAREILESFPFRPARISKYVYGISLLRSKCYI